MKNSLEAALKARFRQELNLQDSTASNELHACLPKQLLPEAVRWLRDEFGATLTTMTGSDERGLSGSYRLYYVFSIPKSDLFVSLATAVGDADSTFPSVTPDLPAAHWYEREVQDLLGLRPVGHPDPRPLVLHGDWPSGAFPLRRDFPANHRPARVPADIPMQRVDGHGVFEIPVGPIHAGIIEPGHFRFSSVGDRVINLEARLFYTHRGVEKACEDKPLFKALLLAERICGVCAFSHSLAFCQAIERVAGVEAPPRARYIRTIFGELERLYNHVGDVGNICAGTGFHFGTSQGGRLKESLMALNESLAGNRYLRGINVPGGVVRDLSAMDAHRILDVSDNLEREFADLIEVLLGAASFVDRLRGTGILPREAAGDLGVVGPAARASGLDIDCRRDHPYAAYANMDFKVPVHTTGDVAARFRVRVDEIFESIRMIRQALDALPAGQLVEDPGPVPAYRSALGYAESPRGEDVHWVMTGPGGTIYRYRIRSASYCNWPAVPVTVPGNIVPDFPLINKSFELCYSCTDR